MSAANASDANAELEGLLAVARNKPAIAKMAYSHDAMVDIIIANPGISQNAIAEIFGYTPSWISQIITSDTFQTALAKRREQLIDPVVMAEVKSQFESLVARSLDILQQKLNRPANEIPDNLALRTLEISSRAAGYGVKDAVPQTGGTPVEVNIHLEQLGGGLVALLQRKRREAGAIDVTPQIGQPVRGANPESGSEPSASIAQQIAQLTDHHEG